VEDPIQLLTGHFALVGGALMVLGCWVAWPRHLNALGTSPRTFSFSRSQTAFGLILAVLGLIFLTFGLVAHPLY
jgi:hypothetical protein